MNSLDRFTAFRIIDRYQVGKPLSTETLPPPTQNKIFTQGNKVDMSSGDNQLSPSKKWMLCKQRLTADQK